jgi:hypothetical protein
MISGRYPPIVSQEFFKKKLGIFSKDKTPTSIGVTLFQKPAEFSCLVRYHPDRHCCSYKMNV